MVYDWAIRAEMGECADVALGTVVTADLLRYDLGKLMWCNQHICIDYIFIHHRSCFEDYQVKIH